MLSAIRMTGILAVAITVGGTSVISLASEEAEMEFKKLHEEYVSKYKPLAIASEKAWWEASITGSDEAFNTRKEAQNKLVELHSQADTFAKLKKLREAGEVKDPELARLLEVMYLEFLPGQADVELQKKIVALEADMEQIFNTHRSQIDGQPTTENKVREIISESTDSAMAEKAWRGYMAVGAGIEAKLKELVALRNESARQLGFPNFFSMTLELQEIDEAELIKLFDELDELTGKEFASLKNELDQLRAKKFGVETTALRPWHFGDLFFQEAPDLDEVNMDDVLKDKDLPAMARAYYESMGMDVDGILSRSDLYEKEGKSPHAFCTNIDRDQDVRVLCNIKPNAYWLDTLLHELGHAVYDQYIAKDVPFVIHGPSHILTTEGVAMLFGAMSKNGDWLSNALKMSPEEAGKYLASAKRTLRAEKLIFSRWAQVMLRFEQGMYSNPDQDLNKLWWDLKKKYQLLNPPDGKLGPDYGAKFHVVGAPVYYHNYLMGDLFACQVQDYVAKNVMGLDSATSTSFWGSSKAGDYMKEKVFGPGNRLKWNDLTRSATGQPLTARYFAEQYVAGK